LRYSIPVLLVQMVVAQPMVSHVSKCFTTFCTDIILWDENARARVTARGRPSGTATAVMNY